jgi:hypothetical protein
MPDVVSSKPSVLELLQERRHDARGRHRAAQVIDDYDKGETHLS